MITADILLNHTRHSKERTNQRQVDEAMIRKCLK